MMINEIIQRRGERGLTCAWKKLRFVFDCEREEESMKAQCERYEISRETRFCVAAPLPAVGERLDWRN